MGGGGGIVSNISLETYWQEDAAVNSLKPVFVALMKYQGR
jgi:hypothetical protein